MLLVSCGGKQLLVTVQNPSDFRRDKETIEVPLEVVQSKLSSVSSDDISVLNPHGEIIPHQVIKGDSLLSNVLLFQVDVAPQSKVKYVIKNQKSHNFSSEVYGRVVPERMDDFAWENNRIAYRMYGPALESSGEISNGIDVWVKRTDSLIINKWYKGEDYHTDHGEGLDCYKVGRTLGAGAMAPFENGKLWLGNNYSSVKVLANGPIRVCFLLTYQPFDVNGKQVQESRLISLDANTNLNRITEYYSSNMLGVFVVAGIVSRSGGVVKNDKSQGWLAYWEPVNGNNGNTGLAVLFPKGSVGVLTSQGHHLCSTTYADPFCYYAGASWSKAGFKSDAEWFTYIDLFAKKLKSPLIVKIRNSRWIKK